MDNLSLIFAVLILAYAAVETSKMVIRAVRRIRRDMRMGRYKDIAVAMLVLLIALGPIGYYGLHLLEMAHTRMA